MSSKYLFLSLGWFFACLLWGCSSDPVLDPGAPDQVAVTFSVGSSSSLSRAALPGGVPVKVYVFRRDEGAADVANLSVSPFKTVEGVSSGSGSLSDITLTGGDLDVNNNLTVPGGYTYDFVVVVDASGSANGSDLGSLGSGILTGFSHGVDLLAGRKEGVEVSVGQRTINIIFTEYGADAQGNLPRLCSAVLTESRVTQNLLTYLNGNLDYAVSGMDFKQCLPKSANLSFSGDPMALNVQGAGYTSSYSPNVTGAAVKVASPTDVAVSKDGVLLPYPLKTQGQDYNVLTIDFRLNVNGGDVLFSATGVHVPAFDPGFRYRFIVELDHDPAVQAGKVNLLLSVEPWTAVSWQTGMGEDEGHNQFIYALGSWKSVTWHHVMGEGETSNRITIASVSNWRSTTWTSNMGDKD